MITWVITQVITQVITGPDLIREMARVVAPPIALPKRHRLVSCCQMHAMRKLCVRYQHRNACCVLAGSGWLQRT